MMERALVRFHLIVTTSFSLRRPRYETTLPQPRVRKLPPRSNGTNDEAIVWLGTFFNVSWNLVLLKTN
jgi:hypothetical protein